MFIVLQCIWVRVTIKMKITIRGTEEVDTVPYAREISTLLDDLKAKYGYNELDAMLVLKDILASVWKSRK